MTRLPHWMRDKHFVDTAIPEQWNRLFRTLEGPIRFRASRLWQRTCQRISSSVLPNWKKQFISC
jgi:hypothetical protein